MVTQANKEAFNSGKNVKFVESNVYNLPFENDSFDFVWSRFLFEYLLDPLLALEEMRRVTKKNGIIAVGDLDGNCIFNYPMDPQFEKLLFKVVNILKEYGFDPFIGRKLFSLMKNSNLKIFQ